MKRTCEIAALLALIAGGALLSNAQTLPAGLVSRWQAEGNIADSAGTNHGSIYVPPQRLDYVAGQAGQAFYFNDAIISVPDSPDLRPTNVTVQCWVKGTNTFGYRYIVGKARGAGGISYAIYTAASGGAIFWVERAGTPDWVPSGDAGQVIWDGNWHHLTGTYDGNSSHLYVDGVEAGTGTEGAGEIDYSEPQPLIFGDYQLARGLPYSGALDEVKVFSRAMTAEEAMETYTNPSSPAASNGLVGWWKADGNLLDSWGTHHGTQPQPARLFEFGPGKNGLAFFPKNGIATVPDSATLQPANLTVQAWIKSVAPGPYRYIICKARDAGGVSFAVYTGEFRGLRFFVNLAGGGTVLTPTIAPETIWDGAWHLATATFDGSMVRFYVDGLEVGAGTEAIGSIDYSNPQSLIFADYQVAGGLPFLGEIDDVQLYDRALTAAEVLEYHTQSKFVSWWQASGDASDSVGANEGALVGSVSFGLGRLSGGSFKTDGGRVEVPDAASLRPANLTVEAMVNGVAPGANKYIVSKSNTSGDASYALFTGADGGLAFYVTLSGGRVVSPVMGTSIWDGNYHAVAGTYDGQKVRLFVDGKEVGSGNPATGGIVYGTSQSAGKLLFGDFSDAGSTANFKGNIDEVKIYTVALAAVDVFNNAFQPVLIIDHPISQTFTPGANVTLSVRAQGPTGVTYEWQAHGTNLPGDTSATLVLTNAQAAQAGDYRVLVSGPTLQYTSGKVGQAFRVGTGGMARIPVEPAFVSQNFTLQCWARATSPGPWKHLACKARHPTFWSASYDFYTDANGNLNWTVVIGDPPAGVVATADSTMWDGQWHQLTGTWDGFIGRLYIDGVLVREADSFGGGAVNYQTNFLNGDLLLGDVLGSPSEFHFPGDLDEVKFFDHALSDAEVQTSYTNLNAANGLVSWWKGEDNTGDSVSSHDGIPLPPAGSVLSDVAVLTAAAVTPVLGSATTSGGNFQATLSGPTGMSYVILRSADLSNWTPLVTNTVPFTFTDPLAAGTGGRFYRAVSQ
jgi:hypothetical protein